ncbi:hypothetical protein [Ketobacter sp.]|uniref:hypothetical protein n=1 Tax=Ketobacter sp. TaxID=2083498 RepID=UPI0025C3A0B9|nr:hypothetical protein [Ketobacter sp.]
MRLLLVFILLLSGCASNPQHYAQPIHSAETASLSNISTRNSVNDWIRFQVTYIDELWLSYRRPWYDPFRDMDTILLSSGQHHIVVKAEFNRSNVDCPCTAIGDLNFHAEPGKSYKVNGELVGDAVRFWVEELPSGQLASDAVASPYVKLKYSSPIMLFY